MSASTSKGALNGIPKLIKCKKYTCSSYRSLNQPNYISVLSNFRRESPSPTTLNITSPCFRESCTTLLKPTFLVRGFSSATFLAIRTFLRTDSRQELENTSTCERKHRANQRRVGAFICPERNPRNFYE